MDNSQKRNFKKPINIKHTEAPLTATGLAKTKADNTHCW